MRTFLATILALVVSIIIYKALFLIVGIIIAQFDIVADSELIHNLEAGKTIIPFMIAIFLSIKVFKKVRKQNLNK
ncbi:MAG: Unknown protein [uncultured Sulfurovum sp.]|uniref:Uncharacterized protein n=1 Tax=uncultured Sulfurovum sp. TaxID=269237 RepID=A0A6S6TAM3_9BACT|nr:MAG: Unknown protein [uncultured Sulfurovum sp.]